jgi:hypothetical protein
MSIALSSPPMIADQNIGSFRSSMIAGVGASRTSLMSTPPGRNLTQHLIRYSRLGGISQGACLNNALAVRYRSTNSTAAFVFVIQAPDFDKEVDTGMVKPEFTATAWSRSAPWHFWVLACF